MKTKITILHPFTPLAVGVVEESVPEYHSRPHAKAMENLSRTGDFDCAMEYFTGKLFGQCIDKGQLKWKFYPVSRKANGDHKKWKKQFSGSCLQEYKKSVPDLTIINMSGHSSPFSFELSKVIRTKGRQYIAMLGGQHYTDTPRHREYYRNAHHILVHTRQQKIAMEELDMFRYTDIRVFPLGVDCSVFKPSAKLDDDRIEDLSLLYVGRIVEWKRIHLAIEALNKLKINGFAAELKIIGPTSSTSYLKELNELASRYQLKDRVHFLGHLDHDELPKYFKKADLFLLPSDKETFGMVMIESMACGTPVVGIDCPGGPSEVITSGVNGLLCSPEQYAEAILKLFSNHHDLFDLKRQARKKALEEYSIEATTSVLRNSVLTALK